jgi:hypothetical protein
MVETAGVESTLDPFSMAPQTVALVELEKLRVLTVGILGRTAATLRPTTFRIRSKRF